MRKVFIFVVLFVLGCGQEKIHEYQVNMLADDMKKAVEERDADKLHALFSEDAFIEVTFPKEMGGTKQLPLNRYIDDIRKGWSMGIDQTYEIKDLQIEISDNHSTAYITDTVVEEASYNGNKIASAETSEKIEVIMIDGKPKIKSLYAVVKM
ncbi:MAG: nuclear transport factor 2 family protein [Ketobacter sp.]|nr:nuclear transport factor 2 family protein [Planctomycetota bacterium]MCP5017310.1 nuclear transport factor 2 family protein [Ketobacter sp.]